MIQREWASFQVAPFDAAKTFSDKASFFQVAHDVFFCLKIVIIMSAS